jgi:hypothetical protein
MIFIPKNKYLDEYKNSWIEWCCKNDLNNNREFYENKWELLTNDNDNDNDIYKIKEIAKRNNKDKYKEIIDKNLISLIDNALLTDGCVYDIAKIVYYYYNDKYENLT